MAESKRQLKFSNLIREELSTIFLRRFQGAFQGSLVTISDVEMSPDLGLARAYISVFPIAQSDSVMNRLNDHKGQIRGDLGRAIGKEVRVIPELAFFNDNTAESADRIDKLIDNLVIPPEEEENE